MMSPSDLAAYRKSLGLTQADAARILNIRIRTYQRYEWGDRWIPAYRLERLRRAEDDTKKTVQSASCMSIHKDRDMTFYLPLHPEMK